MHACDPLAREGNQPDVFCGFLHSADVIFDPRLQVFPPVFVVRPPLGSAANCVRANVGAPR
jgi:hypothetical protein